MKLLCQVGLLDWSAYEVYISYKKVLYWQTCFRPDRKVITPLQHSLRHWIWLAQQVLSPICHHEFLRWSTCKRCAIHAYARARLRSCHSLEHSLQKWRWIHVACAKNGMFFFDGPSLPVKKKKGSIWNDYPSGSSAIQILTVEHDVTWLDVSIVREFDTSNLFYGCNPGRLLASSIVALFKFERKCSYSKEHTVVENGEEKQTFSSEKNATELTPGRSARFSAVSKICLNIVKHSWLGIPPLPSTFHPRFSSQLYSLPECSHESWMVHWPVMSWAFSRGTLLEKWLIITFTWWLAMQLGRQSLFRRLAFHGLCPTLPKIKMSP